MSPTYPSGAYVLTDKFSYRFSQPARGDIIIFTSPMKRDVDFIERVIGLPGETVSISKGQVYVNGSLLSEPYLTSGMVTEPGDFLKEGQAVTIPEGKYITMGDNRQHSMDSRFWGLLPRGNIIGKVTICYANCNVGN